MKIYRFFLDVKALLELFNLKIQLCLFLFHKMIKFYKYISSPLKSRAFAELFSVKINVICLVEIQMKDLSSTSIYFCRLYQTNISRND